MWPIVLLTLAIVYALLCVTAYLYPPLSRTLFGRRCLQGARRAMVVIAHPDDECMFFGPTIMRLTRQFDCRDIYLLCLSTGDHEGLGRVRKAELGQSCQILGLDRSNILIISHTRLPDDASARWDPQLVAKIILRHILMWDVDMVVTFGCHGVSGHRNHSALYRASRYLLSTRQIPAECSIFTLDDVGLLRKYLGVFDILLCFCFFSKHVVVSTPGQVRTIKRAMTAHKSQMVWFRKLYLLFSRYVVVNCLRDIADANSVEDSEDDDDISTW